MSESMIPAGVSLCTVTFGPPVSFAGRGGKVTVTLTSTHTVIHSASGVQLRSGDDLLETTIDGDNLSFQVPHVDQPGFVDSSGAAVTNWAYTITGEVKFGKTKIPVNRSFQVFVGQDSVDLDLVPTGPVTPGVTAPSASIVSVAGLTGNPSAQQVVDAIQTPLSASYAPKWKANTAYTTGQVVMSPNGGIVKAIAGFTSGATYDATKWIVADGPAAAIDAVVTPRYDPINGNVIVGLGDSTMQNEASDNPYNGTTLRMQNAWLVRAAQVLKQRIRIAKMAGVWGDTTQQMIDRFETAVTAHNPDVVLILGSRNDTTVATSLANVATLVSKVRAIRATPIVCIPLPTLTSSADRQRMTTTATRLRAWCLTNRVRTIDFYSLIVDPATGGIRAAYDSGDAKHLNYAGVKAMSDYAATTLAALIPPASDVVALDKADTDSKVANPFFEGISDPNNTGFTTGSWSIGFKPVSGFENYTTADVAGWTGKALDISTTPWAGGTVPSAQIRQNIAISAGVMEVGDVIEWTGKFKIPTCTLPAGKRVQAALLFEGANVTVTALDTNSTMTDEGVFRIRATIPAGTTSIRQQFLIPPDATGTAHLQVNAIRCVNLTRLGAL